MKAWLKQLIPPFLLSLVRNASRPRHPTFNTYAEATAACGKDTCQSSDLVKAVVEKNLVFRERLESCPAFDLRTLGSIFPLSIASTGNRLNVIDFGGGAGYHYTIANKTLGASTRLRWNVVETKAMANEAQRLADGNLKFFDNIEGAKNDLGEVDLVFTSSTLQYCPSPLDCLKELVEVGGKYLYITRTPFLESGQGIVTLQTSRLSANGPGPLPEGFADRKITYPITYASRSAVEDILRERYEIRFRTQEGREAFDAGNDNVDTNGYFCVRKY